MKSLRAPFAIESIQLKPAILLFFFLSISISCLAQEVGFLHGQLIDADSREGIPFATIKMESRAIGVISNNDGTFKVPLEYLDLSDRVLISCMGYISKEIEINELRVGQINSIELKPGSFDLREAVVSGDARVIGAKRIVQLAINSITRNYPAESFGLVGYYRDYQVKNGTYTNLSEAIISIQDSGFETKHMLDNEYQLLSYKRNPDFEVDSFARQPYDYEGMNKIVPSARIENEGGNEFIILRMHDVIRNYGIETFSFIDSLSSRFLESHAFRLAGRTNYGSEMVYEIDVDYESEYYNVEGKLFINTSDFAIHKLNYSVFKRRQPLFYNKAENGDERFTDGFQKTRQELLYRIQIEYARGFEQRMYLNYISFYNKFLLQRPAKFFSKFLIHLPDNSFKIYMNKMPDSPERIRLKDFRVRYKNKQLPLEDFYFLERERSFVLCPNFEHRSSVEAFREIFTPNNETRQVAHINYDYENIEDGEGNKLDERTWEYIHQYREFFTQEIKQHQQESLTDTERMLKDYPLQSDLQPIVDSPFGKNYWTNTPLPSLKE